MTRKGFKFLAINNCRWIVHYHAPLLLSEYVQEIGCAGRDGEPAEAVTLVSKPTGFLDPADKQRRQFFEHQMRSQQAALQLVKTLPVEATVSTVTRQFKDGAIALSLLHGSGQLTWRDPFHYGIQSTQAQSKSMAHLHESATQTMTRYLTTRRCRWKFLLEAFGFANESQALRCGHCDSCQR